MFCCFSIRNGGKQVNILRFVSLLIIMCNFSNYFFLLLSLNPKAISNSDPVWVILAGEVRKNSSRAGSKLLKNVWHWMKVFLKALEMDGWAIFNVEPNK